MSAWKLVVNFAIPPALVLTVLLVLPTPLFVKKWLLVFTRKVLFLNVLGNFKLVHFMIVLTGAAFTSCSLQTYHLYQEHGLGDQNVTPAQRINVLAKKWRTERNWWISMLALLLWGFLNRFYQLMLSHLEEKDANRQLEATVLRLRAQVLEQGAPATKTMDASAPTANVTAVSNGKDAGAHYRGGKNKAM